ncbi:MAG: MerR family transcriptional regulator [Coxiellaceae bacterium]|nr:MAG: MerR family transcriptional regulator [Coxiellaceae bacterium]
MTVNKEIHTGTVVDDQITYTIVEVCDICHIPVNEVRLLIEYGIVQPEGKMQQDWQFTLRELQRIQRALRLQRDLEIDLAGIALAIELLDEIDDMRNKVSLLEQQLRILLNHH